MIKKILGIGTGVAALAAGVYGYRHFANSGPQPAAAAVPETARVIKLGGESAAPVAPGKVTIAPVTPRQMPPKASDAKPPATQPLATSQTVAAPTTSKPGPTVAPKAGPTIAPAPTKPAKSLTPATQPAQPKPTAPQPTAAKKKVISLTGDPQANAGGAAASKLTAQEKLALGQIKQLQTLRNAIGVWRARNSGEVPNFVEGPMWEQLLRDESGRVVGKPPVNALNGFSRVLPVSVDPAPGEAAGNGVGFVYAVNSGRLFATDAMGRVFDEGSVDAVALESRAAREMPAKDQERYLLNAIDAVRGQIVKYATHHNGRPPEFARYAAFEQLMKPTLPDGRLAEGAASGPQYGPYLLSMPINPFNGRHKVAVLPGELRPGQRIERTDVGFVFSASTNRFFAIDAAGLVYDDAKARAGYIPPEAGGTGAATPRGAATGAAADTSALQALRAFLDQYQRQHNGAVPDFKRYSRWEQLTGKTRADGKPDPAGLFGPYLFKTPVNSRNNSSDVAVVGRVVKGYKPTKTAGYVFDTSSGSIFLTDEFGTVIIDD